MLRELNSTGFVEAHEAMFSRRAVAAAWVDWEETLEKLGETRRFPLAW